MILSIKHILYFIPNDLEFIKKKKINVYATTSKARCRHFKMFDHVI